MLLTTCRCADQHPGRAHAFDEARAQRTEKQRWQRVRNAEIVYGRQLRAVADQVGRLVKGFEPGDLSYSAQLQNALREYAKVITPWARSVSARMIADVGQRDAAMWRSFTQEMGLGMREAIRRAPTGEFLREMLAENVALITSLPIEAGQRVHELTLRALETSERAEEIAKEIMRTGEVTKSRATLIARTEVSRTASGLIEVRAKHVGSPGYYWRTSKDADVRNVDGNPKGSHRLLEGKFIAWDKPPVASTNGMRYHAGQGPNCRCWPEPSLPDEPI